MKPQIALSMFEKEDKMMVTSAMLTQTDYYETISGIDLFFFV